MTLVPGLDVEGPVRAEVFMVCHDGRQILLTGPDGPTPWHIESVAGEHPIDLVHRIVADTVGDPLLIHSTSWRWEGEAVVLTFLVVISPEAARGMASVTLQRSDLARSTATAAPGTIRSWQVLEHGLRHLAWLAHEDEAVSSALSLAWHRTLTGYVPAPFQQLG